MELCRLRNLNRRLERRYVDARRHAKRADRYIDNCHIAIAVLLAGVVLLGTLSTMLWLNYNAATELNVQLSMASVGQ